MTAKPTTSVDHAKVAEAIDTRLPRVWAVYSRVRQEAFHLSILGFIHYVAAAVPDVAYIDLSVTDQGGETMTFRHFGIAENRYLAWRPNSDQYQFEEIDGQVFVKVDDEVFEDPDGLNEDTITEYCWSVEEPQLKDTTWYESYGSRNSGYGRIWVARALLDLNPTFEGFIGETLDPMPDPNDAAAVAAWLARETAPEES